MTTIDTGQTPQCPGIGAMGAKYIESQGNPETPDILKAGSRTPSIRVGGNPEGRLPGSRGQMEYVV
jgi:hypothetical protein